MPAKYVVDTHALIWYLEGNPRLGPTAREIMKDPRNTLFLPIIALAEACWIVEHGRSSIPSVVDLIRDVDSDPRITIVPLNREIFDRYLAVPATIEMHDRLIIAALLELAASGDPIAMLTADQTVRTCGVVSTVW